MGRPVFAGQLLAWSRGALLQHEPKRALGWLDWSRRLGADPVEREFLTARAYRKLGEFGRVREHLQRVLDFGGNQSRVRREEWLALAQSGQLRQAEPHLSELLTRPEGDEPEICEAFVNGFFINHRHADALNLLEPWIADYPRDPYPHIVRAKVYAESFSLKDAAINYRRALELAPKSTVAALGLADVLSQQKLPEEALPLYTAAAKDAKLRDSARLGQARCQRMLGHVDAARTILNELQQDAKPTWDARFELGQLEVDSGNYERASELLTQAVEQQPQRAEARYSLAFALRALDRDAEAEPHLAFAKQARSALDRTGRLTDTILAHPRDPAPRSELGRIYLTYDVPEKGVLWLQSALDCDPGWPDAHQALAEYYAARSAQNPQFEKLAREHRARAAPNPHATPAE
ncbi:MAG TPA: tetratricopeptide repeat protein [Planctomycetaceae bacterium]|nr:tetratricopeptide repeat protein [Planctomycetaceae bacterium]